jgi:hypothetical protein
MIRPTGRADLCKVGAFEVGAVNQQAARIAPRVIFCWRVGSVISDIRY